MAHITAGDISQVLYQNESTYGTPSGDGKYYGEIGEGGKFQMQDSSNPYISYKYGSRSFDPTKYVERQRDAAYTAILEARDDQGWENIIEQATGNGGTSAYGSLPSTTKTIYVRTGESTHHDYATYYGCKTDSLKISADAPGGIVKFEESVLASYADHNTLPNVTLATPSGYALQWRAPTYFNGSEIYPQNFSIQINNNLGRSYVPGASGAITGALLEGRREITAEFELWMEDLSYIIDSIRFNVLSSAKITLGVDNPMELTFINPRWMADGDYPGLIQDKQRDKIRFRADGITIAAPQE